MATVTDVIAAGRRDILSLEPDILADLLRMYDDAWRFSERQIGRYESQIQAAIDRGGTVRESWLRQQTWYRQLQASIDAEMSRFQSEALQAITRGQRAAVGIASETAVGFTGAVGISPGIVARVNAGAVERWVSALRPDSPLRDVFARYSPRLERIIVESMTEGIGTGQGVTNIVRTIRKQAGTDAVGGRLHSTVRHETLRAYRGSQRDQFGAMPDGVIESYRWSAQLSTRTCALCWALHNTLSDEYRMDQHVACRCVQVPVVSATYIPRRPFGMTGEERFARLSEADKRKILPSAEHYRLYESGVPLSAIVGHSESKTWGPSVRIKSAAELRGAA